MAQPPPIFVRNRILTALSAADAQRLHPCLEYVSLPLHQVLIEAHQPIEHVHFLESGLSSDTTTGDGGEMEVGMIGREGLGRVCKGCRAGFAPPFRGRDAL